MSLRSSLRAGQSGLVRALRWLSAPLRGVWPRFPEAVMGLVALAIIGLGMLSYSPSVVRSASNWVSGNKYAALLDGMLNPMRSRHGLLQPDVPLYDLKIAKNHLHAIDLMIEKAKQQGYMTDDMKLWVNAKLYHDGKTYDVNVRVRGDLRNHWEGPKKSWAIRFSRQKLDDNGKVIDEPVYLQEGREMARRRINLIIPSDRDFAVAPFVNKVMHDEGLVTMHDRFAILRINGLVQGLYYEVEDFDNTLLASHRRPETPIFGENDRPLHFEQYTKLGTPVAADARYDLASVRRDVEPANDLGMRAMERLFDFCNHPTPEGFRRAKITLDWNKYLTFRAMTTLLNTNHVRFGSDNLRLFYDSSRGLLEPIPWDAHLVKLPREPGTVDFWNSHGPDELQRATLTDPQLRLERNKVLWGLVADRKKLLDKYDEIHQHLRPLAWNDVLVTPIQGHKMDELRKVMVYNIDRVRKVLGTTGGSLVYRLDANDRATIDLACTNFCGIDVGTLLLTDKKVFEGSYKLLEDTNGNGVLDGLDQPLAQADAEKGVVRFAVNKQVLPGVQYGADTLEGRHWEYMDTLVGRKRLFLLGKLTPAKRDPLVWTPPTISATAANAVTGAKIASAPIEDSKALGSNSLGIAAYDATDPYDPEAAERSLAEFLAKYPQFHASESKPGAVELSGSVTFNNLVVVPKSAPLVLQSGTDIALAPGTSFLSYGGLTAIGTADRPIRIRNAVENEAFGTFACVRPSERKVVLRHVDIQGGGQAQVNGILFTGGFAVHNGDLDLLDCQVHDMWSEDGVNLKNGALNMQRCLIARTNSDALDLDFCTGKVVDCRFADIKGDGVDISGSRVLVAGNLFSHMGDKGTSVGEESYPTILNNVYYDCGIGVSCKDLSHPKVAHCTFIGNATAIEAKRKKPMFGGASGEFVSCVFSDNKAFLSEDYFSRGQVDVRASIVDQPMKFKLSWQAKAGFVAPEIGDFRLRSDALPPDFVDSPAPDWCKLDGGQREPLAGLPGIVTVPALAGASLSNP